MSRPGPIVVSVLAGYQHLVKVATIAPAFDALGVRHLTLDTGSQGYTKGRHLAQDLGLASPDMQLHLPSFGSTAKADRISADHQQLRASLASLDPQIVLVYGDLAGSVDAAAAARSLGLFVVHVEAGRRSFDPHDPEEHNRTILDSLADLLLAPSHFAWSNLAAAGFESRSQIVGSSAAELFATTTQRATSLAAPHHDVVMAFHRSDTVRARGRMKLIDQLVSEVAGLGATTLLVTYSDDPIPPPTATATTTAVSRLRFHDYVAALNGATCLVTDSTGMQDDAFTIGLPTLTVRTHTHCVESIRSGTNTLVGFDVGRAVEQVSRALEHRSAPKRIDALALGWQGAGARVASAVVASDRAVTR